MSNRDLITDELFNPVPVLEACIDQHGRAYEPTDAQVPLLNDRTRFQVWLMGRRAGKSKTAAKRAIIEAMKPHRRVWIIAPTYSLTEKIYREIYWDLTKNLRGWLESDPKNSKQEMSARFITGSEIVCKSADDPNQLVGDSLDLVIVDESGWVKDLAIDLLLPALNDINPATGLAKGKLIAVGTPREHNWFKDMYDYGCLSHEEQKELFGGKVLYKSYHADSFSNPHIDHDSIRAEAKRMPADLWRQEYKAEFLSEGGLVFDIKRDHLYVPGFRSLKPGQTTYVGIDLARANDYTVLVALNSRYEQIAYRRENQISWKQIKENLKRDIERFAQNGPVVVAMDATAGSVGDPIVEEFSSYFGSNSFVTILPVGFSGAGNVKINMIEDLKLKISDGLIKIWDLPEIYNEFKDYSFTQSKDGKIKYHAPGKKHDDIVTAFALALQATRRGEIIVSW